MVYGRNVIVVLLNIIAVTIAEKCFTGEDARSNIEQWIRISIEGCDQSGDCPETRFYDADLTYIKVEYRISLDID